MALEDARSENDNESRPTAVVDRRQLLLDAGWELFQNLPLTSIFSGITTAAVAAKAGVTTGSFFHHFPNAAAFADALVLQHAELKTPSLSNFRALTDIGPDEEIDGNTFVHRIANELWQVHLESSSYEADMIRVLTLWTHRSARLSNPVERYEIAGDVVLDVIQTRERIASSTWRELMKRGNFEFISGFTVAEAAMVLTALFDGLAIRHAVDPDAVSNTIYADIAWIITNAITGPRQTTHVPNGHLHPREVHGGTRSNKTNLSPQAQSGARRRSESKVQVLQHCADMFDDGWESVTVTDIAQSAKVSAQTVINVFGNVRMVAATSFAHHLVSISVAASTSAFATPEVELAAILESLAESSSRDPHPARALLSERLILNSRPHIGTQGLNVRMEVPLDRLIVRPLVDLGLSNDDAASTADMLINFVIGRSLGRTSNHLQTAELAIRLIDIPTPQATNA